MEQASIHQPSVTTLKTSISLPAVIHDRGCKRMTKEGYHSFSEYVHFLIRQDTAQRPSQRRTA